MDLLIPCVLFLFVAIFAAAFFYKKTHELEKIRLDLLVEMGDLRKQQAQSKNLTVEAQQILHDMTAHGASIVRITPISPTEVFWRSPK